MNKRRTRGLHKMIAAMLILILIAGCLSGCGSGAPSHANNNSSQGNSNSSSAEGGNTVPSNSEENEPAQEYKSGKETAALLSEAELYFYGGPGVKADYGKAKELYEKALAKGSPLAAHMLAMLALADDTESDWENIQKEFDTWEQLAVLGANGPAEKGDPESCIAMGMVAINTKEPKAGVRYLETAAQAEEPYSTMAMTALGELYQKAGSREDYGIAAQWFKRAADSGSKRAVYLLAQHYYINLNDQTKAVEWWKKAQDAGYDVWYSLASSYNLLKDYNAAAEAYQKGMEAGNNACAYGLGNMYYAGAGVEKNYAKALELYARYLKGRPSFEGKSYTDMNEKTIRGYIDNMISSGAVDKNTVLSIMGSDFLEQ